MHGLPRETASLRLRQIVPDDAAPMMALNAEPTTSQWLPSHVYPNLAEARSRMEYLIYCYSTPGHPLLAPYVLAVEHKNNGNLLGHVGFSEFDSEVEVSYAIAESSRGRGYGTEALVCACNWAAAAFALPRLLAITESANAGSHQLLNRARFVQVHAERMLLQGKEQLVCRYYWHPQSQGSGA
jgi:[ribosomal protein S5]-alanine N-acetyltransferase